MLLFTLGGAVAPRCRSLQSCAGTPKKRNPGEEIQITGCILFLQTEVRKRARGSFPSCSWKALLLLNIYARLAPEKQESRIPLVLGAVPADKT